MGFILPSDLPLHTTFENHFLNHLMSLDELRSKTALLEEQVCKLKQENARLSRDVLSVEQEEEHIANQLIKRLDDARTEKERLILAVEQEEEYITNTLQRKLSELSKEKVVIENQIEQEEEFLTNKMQKELEQYTTERDQLQHQINIEQDRKAALQSEYSDNVNRLEVQQKEYAKQKNHMEDKIKKLHTDNFVLKQKLDSIKQQIAQLKQEKVQLEMNAECQSEREFFDQKRTRINNKPKPKANTNTLAVPSDRFRTTTPIEISGRVADDEGFFPGEDEDDLDTFGGSVPSFIGRGPLNQMSRSMKTRQSPPPISASPISVGSLVSSSLPRNPLTHPKDGSRTCLQSGILKKLRSDGSWGQYQFYAYDNGELVCSDTNDMGVSIHINLDTVTAIEDCSKQLVQDTSDTYHPNFTFELKTRFCSYFISCENENEQQTWTQLLRELSPICSA